MARISIPHGNEKLLSIYFQYHMARMSIPHGNEKLPKQASHVPKVYKYILP
jgi:hypothetical protein